MRFCVSQTDIGNLVLGIADKLPLHDLGVLVAQVKLVFIRLEFVERRLKISIGYHVFNHHELCEFEELLFQSLSKVVIFRLTSEIVKIFTQRCHEVLLRHANVSPNQRFSFYNFSEVKS